MGRVIVDSFLLGGARHRTPRAWPRVRRGYAAIGGRPLDERRIEVLARQGLIARDGNRLAATPSGRLVLNRLILELAA